MKLAVPVNEDHETICVSFGRAPEFAIYDETNKGIEFVLNEASASSGGAGVQAAQQLVDLEIGVLIAPRCGENAAEVLNAAEIKIYKNKTDVLKKELEAYFEDQLELLTHITPGFHGHGFA